MTEEETEVVERPWRAPRWLTWSATVAAGLLLSLAASVVWAGAFRLDLFPIFAQLYAFRVQLIVGLLAVAAVVLLVARGRGRRWGIALLVLALSPLPQVAPRVVAGADTGSPALRVLAVNVQANRADPGLIADIAVQRHADVVVLPEASAGYARKVAERAGAAGLDFVVDTDNPLVPTGHVGDVARHFGGPFPTSLLVRTGLAPMFDREHPSGTLGSLTAEVRVGGGVVIAAVHPSPPIPFREADWQADNLLLRDLCAAGTPIVIAGDFNATLDHSVLRDLLAAGCRDAAESTGKGLTGTWPAAAPWPLRVPIDHLLVNPTAGAVLGYEVVDVPGTDHLGTFTVLGPPSSH